MTRALLIGSNRRNARALRELLASLQACVPEILTTPIVIVEGGYAERRVVTEGLVTTVRAAHNSIDFTALIEACSLPFSEYFFVHDTCTVGPRFLALVAERCPPGVTASFKFPSMNMGAYPASVLRRHRDALVSTFLNTDEARAQEFKALCVREEDWIFKAEGAAHAFLSSGPPRMLGPPFPRYGIALRIGEYYADLDLTKWKANWFVKDTYELAL